MDPIERRRLKSLINLKRHRALVKHRLEKTIPLIDIDKILRNCKREFTRNHQMNQDINVNNSSRECDEECSSVRDPGQDNQDDEPDESEIDQNENPGCGPSENVESDQETDHDENVGCDEDNSESDDEDCNFNENRVQSPEIQLLKEWAIRNKIPHVHLSSLLMILRERLLPELPRSSKTFLGTTKAVYDVVGMDDADRKTTGNFTYIGIEQGLKKCINSEAHKDNTVKLQFNFDGLPLSGSSSKTAWPILCKVHNHFAFYEPFVVAIYVGRSKPLDLWSYLRQFIKELNELLTNSIEFNGTRFKVVIHSIICDTPARAYIKAIVGHTGFHACERCNVIGSRSDNTTVFPDIGNARTDDSFRNYDDVNHHIDRSPLTMIQPTNIDMVHSFVLDFMHLGFIGVMGKLLEYWFSEKHNKTFRTSQRCKDEVSRRLELIREQVPFEFSRKIRTLLEFSRYKATELKFFAFYVGPIVLKDMISEEQYKNFIFFHFASRILWHRRTALLRENVNKANNLYHIFFNQLKKIYTNKSTVINMHNINHVCDDIFHLQCSLSEMTAFPFENLLGKIKRLLRSPSNTVAQLCRRLYEYNTINHEAPLLYEIQIIKEYNNTIKKLKYREAIITTQAPDNMVLLQNNHIFQIKNMYRRDQSDDILVEGLKWNIKDHIYRYPEIMSGELNSWELKKPTTQNIVIFPVQSISIKMALFALNLDHVNQENRYFTVPLLHG